MSLRTPPGATDRLGVSSQRRWTRVLVRVGLPALVVGGVLAMAMRDRSTLREGLAALPYADVSWLLFAAGLAALLWVAGTVSQLGALSVRPPVGRLLAVQVAASFANSLLPAGTGGLAVNVRFLRRFGLTRESAIAAQALNTTVGAVSHVAMLGVALLLAPHVLVPQAIPGIGPALHAFGHSHAGVVALAVAVTLLASGAAVKALPALRTELRVLLAVLRDPRRGLQLWGGAVSAPLLHALVLVAVLHALGAPLPVSATVLTYLAASAVSAFVPSPGGVGALDVTLSGALVAAGADTTTALSAVLAYRLVTVWAPLLPGALALGLLVRRRIL
ncbi:lysylphosphatidylglycerol synthase transmembrane domain-containing protein [Motilibacter rhizosphaerae]|uniref:lysylphosphatidylglycerol synthase transmembrane domain-containing protein n=1 Tax=Motilibacter rhizosphaerae TaxID=598652 RepID=UPI00102ACE9E|nr:lysylphosphatidylglycerol synthase transmembrane domain-containing protein [Motilibacter rhizosphaerae]